MTPAAQPDFDRCAGHYDTHANVQREAAAWLAAWLPENMTGHALEIGAGTGIFTRHLADRATSLVATDLAPRMVHHGRTAVPSASWIVAGADQPPDDQHFSWILNASLAQWLPDPAASFRAWHRVCAPQARLLGGWFIRGTLSSFYAACPEASPFVWRDADQWLAILRQSGWQPVRHETRTFHRHHRNTASMLREIHNAGAIIPHRLGAGRLRRAIRQHDQTHGGDQDIETSFVFLRIEAVRA